MMGSIASAVELAKNRSTRFSIMCARRCQEPPVEAVVIPAIWSSGPRGGFLEELEGTGRLRLSCATSSARLEALTPSTLCATPLLAWPVGSLELRRVHSPPERAVHDPSIACAASSGGSVSREQRAKLALRLASSPGRGLSSCRQWCRLTPPRGAGDPASHSMLPAEVRDAIVYGLGYKP